MTMTDDPPPSPESAALVIVGHGSHLNPRSAEPVYKHADTLRDQNVFAEVRTSFWKEEPSPREVLRTVESDDVVVVPLFMATGYFTEHVVPRELGVANGCNLAIDKRVWYSDPVGTHDTMTEVVLKRAERITGERDLTADFGLAVVGHGTDRNEKSARAARRHAARIRNRGQFDEVRALFMDESPAVEDLTDYFEMDDVVIVPLFVADGYHTQEDIPEDVGLTDDYRDGYNVPARVHGHRIWYAGAVGTEPLLADVIRERALCALDSKGESRMETTIRNETESEQDRPQRVFLRWVDNAEAAIRTWGELAIASVTDADDGRAYEMRHRDDRHADVTDLNALDKPRDLRDIARVDNGGEFRPLKAAPTLPTGWRLSGLDGETLVRAVEAVYPATIANWHREQKGDLDVTHFQTTADRQTGIYDCVADLDREAVEHAAVACCADEECLKRRRWDYNEGASLNVPRGDGEFPCREPCSLFVAASREFTHIERDVDGNSDRFKQLLSARNAIADGEASEVRDGEVSNPANRIRARYLQSTWSDGAADSFEARDADWSGKVDEVTEGAR